MKHLSRIIWGVVLVAVGVLLALNVLNVMTFDIFFDGWWTLFIIVPCLVGVFTDDDKAGHLVGLAVGVLLLLGCQKVIGFELIWKLMLPVAIVLVGLTLIFRGNFDRRILQAIRATDQQGGQKRVSTAVFSGQTMDCAGQTFEGAALTAVFGGIKCDLRQAVLTRDVVIDVYSIFGGIDLLLPPNVNVRSAATAIFGGVSTAHHPNSDQNGITVYLRGACVFGGVDVK